MLEVRLREPPADISCHGDAIEMCLDPFIERRKVLQSVVGFADRAVPHRPQERRLLHVLRHNAFVHERRNLLWRESFRTLIREPVRNVRHWPLRAN